MTHAHLGDRGLVASVLTAMVAGQAGVTPPWARPPLGCYAAVKRDGRLPGQDGECACYVAKEHLQAVLQRCPPAAFVHFRPTNKWDGIKGWTIGRRVGYVISSMPLALPYTECGPTLRLHFGGSERLACSYLWE